MTLTVEAVYEDGVLKPVEPLPLKEREQVEISIQTQPVKLAQAYGIIGWKGDGETLRRIAEDAEFSILESR